MTVSNVTKSLVDLFNIQSDVENRLDSVKFPDQNAEFGKHNLVFKKTWRKELPKSLLEGALLVGFVASAILLHSTPVGPFLDLLLFVGFLSIGIDLSQRVRDVNKELKLIPSHLFHHVESPDDLFLKLLLWRRNSCLTKLIKQWEDVARPERKKFVDLFLKKMGLKLDEAIKFFQLDQHEKNRLYGFIWEESGRPQGDAFWGENHRFDNIENFKKAFARLKNDN